MDNVLNAIGDSITIEVNSQIMGYVHIESFSDTLNGIQAGVSVYKEFRVQIEGMFWTEWAELNDDNLSENTYTSTNVLKIQVRYTRTGTVTSGEISFVDIEFFGSVKPLESNMPTLYNSIFKDIANSIELDSVSLNLFKKLYFQGILAKYVIRAENRDYYEDRDFIDMFSTVAKFFAILIMFFTRFERMNTDEAMLIEQLRGYGVNINENNIQINELRFLCENLLAEISLRGTSNIFNRNGEELANGEIYPIDGEFVRLTQNNKYDELLFERIPKNRVGWCLGNSSPLYRGTYPSEALNKSGLSGNSIKPEEVDEKIIFSNDIEEVNFNCSDGMIEISIENNIGKAGIGRLSTDDSPIQDFSKAVVCDTQLDYEISFEFACHSQEQVKVISGVDGFDMNGNKLNDAFCRVRDFNVENNFFSVTNVDIIIPNQRYQARCIIHAYSSVIPPLQNYESTNLGVGYSLMFNNPFVKFMIPRIHLYGDSCALDIYSYKIRPLVRGKNILPINGSIVNNCFSLGFIQCQNISHTYYRNNNKNKSQQEITETIEKYLYPFNMTNLFTVTKN